MTKKSYEVLNDPFLNKGTAFTKEERKELELTGLLPPQNSNNWGTSRTSICTIQK